MKTSPWILYGATGYTGRLIVEQCVREGLAPVLGGRNFLQLEAMGQKYGLETRCFDLKNSEEAAHQLRGMKAVLHCAGPFSQTSQPMLEACMKAKVDYLDITGEWPVFEKVLGQAKEIEAAGITAIPGVGFDVVPTDCLAAIVSEALPDATHLRLGFVGVGAKLSPGTAKTAAESFGLPTMIRVNGQLCPVAPLSRKRTIYFGKKTLACYAIPWGDVVTAYASTKIPNIEVYSYMPSSMVRVMKGMQMLGKGLWQSSAMQHLIKQGISYWVQGPEETARSKSFMVLWAEAENAKGKIVVARGQVPEGYTFTVDAAIASVKRVIKGDVAKGALTPSLAFGSGFLATLRDCKIEALADA